MLNANQGATRALADCADIGREGRGHLVRAVQLAEDEGSAFRRIGDFFPSIGRTTVFCGLLGRCRATPKRQQGDQAKSELFHG